MLIMKTTKTTVAVLALATLLTTPFTGWSQDSQEKAKPYPLDLKSTFPTLRLLLPKTRETLMAESYSTIGLNIFSDGSNGVHED